MKKETGRTNVIGKILGILLMCLVTGSMFYGLPRVANASSDEANVSNLITIDTVRFSHSTVTLAYEMPECGYFKVGDIVNLWIEMMPDDWHWFTKDAIVMFACEEYEKLEVQTPTAYVRLPKYLKPPYEWFWMPYGEYKDLLAVINAISWISWVNLIANPNIIGIALKTIDAAHAIWEHLAYTEEGEAPTEEFIRSSISRALIDVQHCHVFGYRVKVPIKLKQLGPVLFKTYCSHIVYPNSRMNTLLEWKFVIARGQVEPGWPAGKPNICRKPTDGFIDFEDGTDGAVIRSSIPGLKFTTTLGLDWIYGDIRTGKYNVYPYGHQGYETNGNFFAWLGVTGDQGRIDFPQGTATYLSVLVSTYSGVKIDAYDAEGNFLATSGWAENNLHTRTFTRLTVEAPGMAYVIVHDTGNYWLIDDLCTDAPGVPRAHYEAAELAKAVIGKNYLTQFYNVFTKGWKDGKFVETGEVEYLDCSGLVFWSYNKAYGAEKYLGKGNPVTYEGADGQYQNNFDVTVSEDELLPGDVLFFDWDDDGHMDHVAMYVGEYEWKGKIQKLKYYTTGGVLRQKASQPIMMTEKIGTAEYDGTYNVVHASGDAGCSYGIRPDTVDRLKMLDGFVGFRRLTEPKVGAEFKSYSPVDLIITDPDGFTINKDTHEIPGVLYYSEWDVNGDGDPDDMVIVPERKIGDYLITVVPEPEASPTDTYCLEVTADGETVVLAENVQIGDIPPQPYILRSTETEINPIIPATIDFDPDTLNLKSKGRWVTAYIELPVGHGYNVSMIDLESLWLNGQVQAEAKPIEIGDYDGDGIPDLMVKFNRKSVQNILEVGEEVKITISGKLTYCRPFEGKDTIKVILPP